MASDMTSNPWDRSIVAAESALRSGNDDQYIGHMREAINFGFQINAHHFHGKQRDLLMAEGLYIPQSSTVQTYQEELPETPTISYRDRVRPSIEDDLFAFSLARQRDELERADNLMVWRVDPVPIYPKVIYNTFAHDQGHYNAKLFPEWVIKQRLRKMKDGGCKINGYSKMSAGDLNHNFPIWQELIHSYMLNLCNSGKCDKALLGHSEWREWRYQIKREPRTA